MHTDLGVRDVTHSLAHLNALCSEDELRHQWWDIRLIEHGVRDALQQRLHGGHAVHDYTSAQAAVVEPQKHDAWTHLRHTNVRC